MSWIMRSRETYVSAVRIQFMTVGTFEEYRRGRWPESVRFEFNLAETYFHGVQLRWPGYPSFSVARSVYK